MGEGGISAQQGLCRHAPGYSAQSELCESTKDNAQLAGGRNVGGGERMSRFNSPTAPRLWPRREDKSPCVRPWELSFLPHSSSYQILPYSGNSMGNESTQESGLAPERKVNITKRKSLPILESMHSQE